MSRIGKQPVDIPDGVNVAVDGPKISVKGPLGELSLELRDRVTVTAADRKVTLEAVDETRESSSLHGLSRTLVANMIQGVSKGFSKALEIHGVGFKANVQGNKLVMSLGYSQPVEYVVPDGITVEVEKGTKISVSGADKQMVGDVAARIRCFYPPEPYKGKGIRYVGEYVRRKVGKTVA